MRLKSTYNFLRSGGPFCYRGIFSGLSNETVGAALYHFILLQASRKKSFVFFGIRPFTNYLYPRSSCCMQADVIPRFKLILIIFFSFYLPGLFIVTAHLIKQYYSKHKTKKMKTIRSIPADAFNYYGPLLQRYARRILKDAAKAELLAKQVLADQYYIDGLRPSKHLLPVLKFDLLNRCHYFRQSRIFDRAPVKVKDVKKMLDLCQTDKLKNQSPNQAFL